MTTSREPKRHEAIVLQDRIGAGGFGVVYRAHHRYLRRDYAVKILTAQASVESFNRFMTEIEVLANLDHPHIVPVIDAGIADLGFGSRPYYLMPLYEDGAWASVDRSIFGRCRNQVVPDEEAMQSTTYPADPYLAAIQVIAGLSQLWDRNLIHKDLKPTNILVRPGYEIIDPRASDNRHVSLPESRNHYLLADLGLIGAVGTTGGMSGTPLFMSPEQAAGGTLHWTTDQFSLGLCILMQILGFDEFFSRRTAGNRGLFRGFPVDEADVLSKMTHEDPAHRYQRPDALIQDLSCLARRVHCYRKEALYAFSRADMDTLRQSGQLTEAQRMKAIASDRVVIEPQDSPHVQSSESSTDNAQAKMPWLRIVLAGLVVQCIVLWIFYHLIAR